MKQRAIATLLVAMGANGALGSNTDSCKMSFIDLRFGIFVPFGINTHTADQWMDIPFVPIDILITERAKAEVAPNNKWDFGGKTYDLPLQIKDIISKRCWFFHANHTTLRSTEILQNLIRQARNMPANLLINVGPDTDRLLRTQYLTVLKTLKAE